MSWLCLMMAVVSTAIGQYNLKRYKLHDKRSLLAMSLLFFIVTPMLSFCALRTIAVDTVYVFTALTIIVVVLLSHFGLKEPIGKQKLAGAGLIVFGVMIYGIR